MSNHTEQSETFNRPRPKLTLDRSNKKVLGVCAGFTRYLEVPAALVRVIYCIACIVSPVLLIVYFVLYWLLEDEDRPARIKAAISGNKFDGSPSARTESQQEAETLEASAFDAEASTERSGFNLRRPLFRSRSNVRVAGVCAGVANYLNVSTFLVRATTLLSLFILGGITIWGYIILWIVLDKEPKAGKKSDKAALHTTRGTAFKDDSADIERCALALRATEKRLRDVEAFITSKQFRLHCEINRI